MLKLVSDEMIAAKTLYDYFKECKDNVLANSISDAENNQFNYVKTVLKNHNVSWTTFDDLIKTEITYKKFLLMAAMSCIFLSVKIPCELWDILKKAMTHMELELIWQCEIKFNKEINFDKNFRY